MLKPEDRPAIKNPELIIEEIPVPQEVGSFQNQVFK